MRRLTMALALCLGTLPARAEPPLPPGWTITYDLEVLGILSASRDDGLRLDAFAGKAGDATARARLEGEIETLREKGRLVSAAPPITATLPGAEVAAADVVVQEKAGTAHERLVTVVPESGLPRLVHVRDGGAGPLGEAAWQAALPLLARLQPLPSDGRTMLAEAAAAKLRELRAKAKHPSPAHALTDEGPSGVPGPYGPARRLSLAVGEGTVVVLAGPWRDPEGQPLAHWLRMEMAGAPEGWRSTERRGLPPPRRDGTLVEAYGRATDGRAVRALACAHRPDGPFRALLAAGPATAFVPTENADAVEALRGLAASLCDESPRAAREAATLAAIALPADAPRPALEGVLYRWRSGMSGSFTTFGYVATALYADGTALASPDLPPDRIDLAASRERQPDDWGAWRREGKGIELREGDGWREATNVVGLLAPLPDGTRFEGRFERHASGGSLIGTSWTSHATVTLREDGTYALSSSSLTASGPASGGSLFAARSCGPDGGSSALSVSGAGLAGGGAREAKGCGDAKRGRYRIEGYAIELSAEDGSTTVLPFYAAPAKEGGSASVMLGATGYDRAAE